MTDINIKDLAGDTENPQDFYDSFRAKLIDVEQFPSMYTFKFILKADAEKIAQVKTIFEHSSSKFTEKDSSGGKYKSITVETYVSTADDVINYYKAVGQIESVMML